MSCCEGKSGQERYPGTGCCGSSCAGSKTGCSASEPRIRSCLCQNNVGCLDRADCGGFRPSGTAATGACPGPCQCAEEEAWNRNIPPKPNCEWLSNFCELRRQWSDHGRQENCKCCNCRPCKTAAPCHPCAPPPPPQPSCSTSTLPPTDCQECCDGRLAGGACGPPSNTSCCSPNLEEFSPLRSYEGCPPPGCNSQIGKCPPNLSACPPSCPPATRCPVPDPCSIPCQVPSSCQPCAPSPRPILKKRSCCQCIGGYCLCQPMPRNCNCPPPVQVDARSDRECSCDCPSSPECACPPSERRFPRTKIRCPNAKLCCPMPRLPPGPKCCCTQCQPCLPPPCDPCTSTKCHSSTPRVKPCRSDSPCPPRSPCRPGTPPPVPCRPIPPCASCRKIGPPCRTPTLYRSSTSSPTRSLARSSSPGGSSTCSTPCKGSEIQADDIGFKDSIEINEKRIPGSHLQSCNHNTGSAATFQNNCNFYHLSKGPSHFQCPICFSVLSWTWFPPLSEVPRSSSAPASTNSSTCIEKHVTTPVQRYSILSKQKNISDSNLHEKVTVKPRKIDRFDCFDKTNEICIPTCAVDQRLDKLVQKLDTGHFVKFSECQQNSETIDDHSYHIPIDCGEFAKSRRQCTCGYDGMSCAPDCTFCCALECATVSPKFDNSKNQGSQFKPVSSLVAHSCETSCKDTIRDDVSKIQCRCGPDENSCAADCNYCCALNCTSSNVRLNDQPTDNKCLSMRQKHPQQCACGSDKMSCATNCEFCCAINCNTPSISRDKYRNTVTKKINENRSNTVLECVSLLSTALNVDKEQIEKRIKRNVQSPGNSKEKINIGNT